MTLRSPPALPPPIAINQRSKYDLFNFHFKVIMNYFEILNCSTSSNEHQIQTEYRRLARIHHPGSHYFVQVLIFLTDKNGSVEVMRKIVEAYEVLSDENKRESYKNWLVAKELNLASGDWTDELTKNRGQMHFKNEEKLQLKGNTSKQTILTRKQLRAQFRNGKL